MNDTELLERFVRDKSQEAFRDLVARHTNLVYASACQRLRDAHAAQDVTQAVFLALARQAKDLSLHVPLPAWLYQVTRYTCAMYQRGEKRRKEREMRAGQDQAIAGAVPEAGWTEIVPRLPAALDSLSSADRTAVLLRFYENASHREIGSALRLSEEAAKKRVNRALEKLRRFFADKGVMLTVTGLAGALTAHVTSAAPTGLAASVSASVLGGATGTLAATETLMLAKGALKAMFIAKVQTVSLTAAACLVVAGTGIVAAKQLSAPSPTPTATPVQSQPSPVVQVVQAATPAMTPTPAKVPSAPATAPANQKLKLSELVSVTVENGKLVGRWIHPTPCDKLGEFETDNPPLRWAARAYPSQLAAPDSFWIDAVQTTGPAGQIGRFNMNASGEKFWLSVGYGKNPQGWDVYIEYLQGRAPGETTKLWINDRGAKQSFEAADFAELRTKAGKEMREYLAPLFPLFTNRDLLTAKTQPAASTRTGGDSSKVFKPIDTTQSGTYGDGKWGYIYAVPAAGSRHGTLKYDGRDLSAAQPGDYILTPWGWMQWQEKRKWLPVAEKPAKGNQLLAP